jgi:hypothetical protein
LKSETFGTAIYNGMTVATIDEQKVYMLVDKTKVTSEDGWKEIGAGSGSLAIENFTLTDDNKVVEATAENIGQIIYITKGVESYPAGPYIVIAEGEVSKLGTTTATGDIAGDVESLKTRVGNVEANKADLTGLTALTKTVNDNYNTYDAHAKDAFIHITQDERTNWNHAHEWSSGNTIDISNLKTVVSTKADASALTNYLTTEQAGINDETVRSLITAETKARVDAISALTEVVDTKAAQSDLNSLSETVETNYNTLNGLITAETKARVDAISALTEVVDTKVNNDVFTAHTTNGDIHITAEERTKWNEVVTNFNTFITGDTEAALNTLVDLQQWIESHGDDAQAMTTAITANLESITSLTQTVDTISGKVENNITAITKNAEDIATKAAQSDLNALAGIVGNETENTGIFGKLSTLAGDVYTKDEADKKFLTGITVDVELNATSTNPVENKALFAEFGKVRDEITSAVTGDVGATLKNYVKKTEINTLNDIALYADTAVTIQMVAGLGTEVVTDAAAKTITISPKISAAANNALSVDENGLYVQAITIEGDDAETVSAN